MTKVAIVKADSYDQQVVEKAMQELLAEFGGMAQFVQPGDRVLVKPNMLEGVDKGKHVTTHPEVVRAVVRAVKQAGGKPMVGDSPGVGSTRKVAEKCGILQICEEEHVPLVSFDEAVSIPYPQGRMLKRLMLAKPFTEADKVISVAKMKTHSFMGVTGAVKNLFGFFVGADKAQFHLRMKNMSDFARMQVDLYECVAPVLSIVDGVTAMEGAGPRNGDCIHCGILLGGQSGFAVDLVMADCMGFAAEQLPIAAAAREAGISPALRDIQLIGSGKERRFHFKEAHTVHSLEGRIPPWLVRLGQNQLTARPAVAAQCMACGRCAGHCPPRAITMREGRAVIDYRKCIRCYCCQELCPADAVLLKDGFLLRLAKQVKKLSGKKNQ
ncbi:hypothetical protein P22_2091 [Propionispora sp. 2/2-37]|uniref:DUF362 domain-containing protein n=1 Tax=Propionispora sp. 2/2-37 TaxID=1677858 RepID=UPI0006BB9480|nr:DUF362 domain-containing protein [Propionispora sp. 2/2-37]CUH96003.1 hypothetical protein P22_2091 [Propionispora sp. 2/2-37]